MVFINGIKNEGNIFKNLRIYSVPYKHRNINSLL